MKQEVERKQGGSPYSLENEKNYINPLIIRYQYIGLSI
jgi:hypothetical protein